MPLQLNRVDADPECSGHLVLVSDENRLARLAALVLVGQSRHAEEVLLGATSDASRISVSIKRVVERQLILPVGVDPSHRDGLLFEIISWIATRWAAGQDDVVSPPHLSSTQQGTDTIKVSFDRKSRRLIRTTVHEQKCTEHPRKRFKEEVLPSFRSYIDGERDPQICQSVVSLLERVSITDDERIAVYDAIVGERKFAFRAALTVAPTSFDAPKMKRLFKGFDQLTTDAATRFGDAMPLQDVRKWFSHFAERVWNEVEKLGV